MTQDAWLGKHPYLRPVADLHKIVEVALAGISLTTAHTPPWDDYLNEFYAGVPLLRSLSTIIDVEHVSTSMAALVGRLALQTLPGTLPEKVHVLDSELRREPDAPRRAMTWLINAESFETTHPDLLHYLGWTILARHLNDVVNAFAMWREEERWLRQYCPMCGALPAMAQLVGVDNGRMRLLYCGYCGTHWNYARVGCPFCGNVDDQRLGLLAIEGEGVLRIDFCKECGGYLKTYVGEGSERLFLADWTSLHLDMIARDHGLKQFAASLYQM